MPYVRCNCGSTARETSTDSTDVNDLDASGKVVGSRTLSCRKDAAVATALKNCSAGSQITIRGGKWSPTRPYKRYAVRVESYNKGKTLYTRNNARPGYAVHARAYFGFPEPNGIWAPIDALVLSAQFGNCGFSSSTGPNPTMSNNMKNRLNTELLQKAGRRQVNYGEAIGESRSTLKMLTGAVIPFVKALLAARKGRFGEVARILGVKRIRNFRPSMTVSEKWLAYQYGWLPLANDIYDSYKLLQNGLDTRPQVLSVSRVITENVNQSTSDANFGHIKTNGEAKYIAKLWFRMRDQDISVLNQIGMINPVEVAWALVPFSFVVDWVLPVGNVLEALSARLGITFVDGFYGLKVTTSCTASGCRKVVSGYTQQGSSPVSVSGSLAFYERSKMVSLPWPAFYTKSPFSSTHVASALALLRTLRRG